MSDRTPVPIWLGYLPSLLYRMGIQVVNRRYDRGKSVITLDRPVISVGNLSVGGTGKTPLSIELLRWLLAAGRHPAIAMRGYGSRNGLQSDEACMYAREFPNLNIVAQPDRLSGLFELFASDRGDAVDCIMLDDGFQHRRIARQFDILLLDARHPPTSDRLLPAGWLREPFSSVCRAHAVVITHAESAARATELRLAVESQGASPLFATCRHVWSKLHVHHAGSVTSEPLESIRGRKVIATCAIGRPEGFVDRLRQLSDVRDALLLRDHDPYARQTVEKLATIARDHKAHAIVCTAKDWSKLSRVPAESWPCPLIVPELQIRFDSGEADLRARLIQVASSPVD